MKLAVIGAAGMLGQHALRAAAAAGHDATAIYRSPQSLRYLEDLDVDKRQADLDDVAGLQKALRGVEAVINAAAYYPTAPRPWRAEVETATAQMAGFYRAARAAGVGRIVYLGGAIALPKRSDGQPADGTERYAAQPSDRNPYLQVKWALDEQALQQAAQGVPVMIAIPSMTFGEYDRGPTTGQLIVGIASGKLRRYVHGQRNVVYAGDAGRGLLQAVERGEPGQRYLLTGSNTDMQTLTASIARLAGREPPQPVALGVARAVATLQKLRYRAFGGALPTISETAIAVMSAGQHLDGSRSAQVLGYAPQVDTETALARSLAWFRANGYC